MDKAPVDPWEQLKTALIMNQPISEMQLLPNQLSTPLHIMYALDNRIINPKNEYGMMHPLSIGKFFLHANEISFLETMLENGKLNAQEKTDLFYNAVVIELNKNAVNLFLRYETNPNASHSLCRDNIALHRIIGYVEHPIITNISEQTRALEMLRWLIAKPQININIQDSIGNTPLHTAIWNNNIPAAELLLSNESIDITITDRSNRTPLCLAKTLRKNSFIMLLTQKNVAHSISK